jgi:WD40 repeat protein
MYTHFSNQIWDLRQKTCVRALNARSPVTAVSYHPNLRVPLVGTVDGVVHLWSSTNFR